jgi:glycine/D-amino acid oxidase-like deaminating enzyme
MSERFDLIVVGAGIVGAACSEAAARRGLKVAVVERRQVGGGTTAAGMGHLVALDGSSAELALCAYSLRCWRYLAQCSALEHQRCGTLWLASTPQQLSRVAERQGRLAAAGVRCERVNEARLYRLEPLLGPGLAGALRVVDDAVVYPPAVAAQLIADARSLGASLWLGAGVQQLCDDGVVLDDGTRLRGRVLVATGIALAELLPELPLRSRKGHLLITTRGSAVIRHQLVELGYADSVHANGAAVAFNLQPRPGGQLLLGSSREYDVADERVSMPVLGRMLNRGFRFMPGLRSLHALRAWTGQRPASPDGLPYLGAVPARPGVWVAAGHEGLGVTTALGSARLVLDLMLGQTPSLDPTPFDPLRVLRLAQPALPQTPSRAVATASGAITSEPAVSYGARA